MCLPATMREVHLVVLQHGMWGCPSDMSYLEGALHQLADPRRVVVLNSDVNAARLTYDGIDVLGDRLAALVVATCERMAAGGLRRVTKVSFMAYSLGGLITRYAIGKLAATGFFVNPAGPAQATATGSAAATASQQRQLLLQPAPWGVPSVRHGRHTDTSSGPYLFYSRGDPSSSRDQHPSATPGSQPLSPTGHQLARTPRSADLANGVKSPTKGSWGWPSRSPQKLPQGQPRSPLQQRHPQREQLQQQAWRLRCPPVQPVNFVTFASPHLGSWQAPTNLYRVAFNAVLPYTLSRTGAQLVMADVFVEEGAQRLPLLAVMAHPGYAFHAGLAMFQKRIILANTRHDATVPFPTSNISMSNPFEVEPSQPINARYPCIVQLSKPPMAPLPLALPGAMPAGPATCLPPALATARPASNTAAQHDAAAAAPAHKPPAGATAAATAAGRNATVTAAAGAPAASSTAGATAQQPACSRQAAGAGSADRLLDMAGNSTSSGHGPAHDPVTPDPLLPCSQSAASSAAAVAVGLCSRRSCCDEVGLAANLAGAGRDAHSPPVEEPRVKVVLDCSNGQAGLETEELRQGTAEHPLVVVRLLTVCQAEAPGSRGCQSAQCSAHRACDAVVGPCPAQPLSAESPPDHHQADGGQLQQQQRSPGQPPAACSSIVSTAASGVLSRASAVTTAGHMLGWLGSRMGWRQKVPAHQQMTEHAAAASELSSSVADGAAPSQNEPPSGTSPAATAPAAVLPGAQIVPLLPGAPQPCTPEPSNSQPAAAAAAAAHGDELDLQQLCDTAPTLQTASSITSSSSLMTSSSSLMTSSSSIMTSCSSSIDIPLPATKGCEGCSHMPGPCPPYTSCVHVRPGACPMPGAASGAHAAPAMQAPTTVALLLASRASPAPRATSCPGVYAPAVPASGSSCQGVGRLPTASRFATTTSSDRTTASVPAPQRAVARRLPRLLPLPWQLQRGSAPPRSTSPSPFRAIQALLPRPLSAPRLAYNSPGAAGSTPNLALARPRLPPPFQRSLSSSLTPVRHSPSYQDSIVPYGYADGRTMLRAGSVPGGMTLLQQLSSTPATPPLFPHTRSARRASYDGSGSVGSWQLSGRAVSAPPDMPAPRLDSSGRLHGEVFVALLPLLVLLWCCMLLWLLAASAHHYAARALGLRRDRSWPIAWPGSSSSTGMISWPSTAAIAAAASSHSQECALSAALEAQTARASSAGQVSCMSLRADCGPSGGPMGASVVAGDAEESAAPSLEAAAAAAPAVGPPAPAPRSMLRSMHSWLHAQPHRSSTSSASTVSWSPWLVLHWPGACVAALAQHAMTAWSHATSSSWGALDDLWLQLVTADWGLADDEGSSTGAAGSRAAAAGHAAAAAVRGSGTSSRSSMTGRRVHAREVARTWAARMVLGAARAVLLGEWLMQCRQRLSGTVPYTHPRQQAPAAATAAAQCGGRGWGWGMSSRAGSKASAQASPDSQGGTSPQDGSTHAAGAVSQQQQQHTTATGASSVPAGQQAALLPEMCAALNQLSWTRVPVDTHHYHAHAAIVVRSPARFAASYGHIVEYAVRQMRDIA